jgi:hypothetical protein
MNIKLWIPVLFLALPVQAAWIEDSVSIDVDTTDAQLIANSMTQFQEILNYLNAENLTSPSRVRVKQFSGRVAKYHWENDSNCAVKDPSTVLPVEMSSSHADFYYEANPSQLYAIDAIFSKVDPCTLPPAPSRLKAYKK